MCVYACVYVHWLITINIKTMGKKKENRSCSPSEVWGHSGGVCVCGGGGGGV